MILREDDSVRNLNMPKRGGVFFFANDYAKLSYKAVLDIKRIGTRQTAPEYILQIEIFRVMTGTGLHIRCILKPFEPLLVNLASEW